MSTRNSTIRATDLVTVVTDLLHVTNRMANDDATTEATRRFCEAEAACLRNVLAAFADHALQVERNAGRAEAAAYKAAESHADTLEVLTGERRARMTELLVAAEESAARHGEHAAQAQSIARQASEVLRRTLQRI